MTDQELLAATPVMADEVLGNCPECGKPVTESPKAYGCTGYREGCKFAIWKDALKGLGKKSISKADAKKLLAGQEVIFKGLKSPKSGKTFEAKGKLQKHEKYGWQIELEF